MPLTLKNISQNIAACSFEFAGETVTMVYWPGLVTEKVFAELQALGKAKNENVLDSFTEFNGMLVRLIKSWDLYEDDEQTSMFPLDANRLSELPISFRMAAIQAILSDIRPEAMTPQTLN